MPRNSSGIYTLPRSAFVAGVTIFSSAFNADCSDIGNALTESIATTGVTPVTGQIKAYSGSRSSPSYGFATNLGCGFYLGDTNQINWVTSSVSLGTINSSATANWDYPHQFNNKVFLNGEAIFNSIAATTTITGDLIVGGGVIVGFVSVPVSDRVALGDINLCLDYDVGTLPIINFDSGDYIGYTRANNLYGLIAAGVGIFSADANGVKANGTLRFPEITAPASASANKARLYARDASGATLMYYKDDQGRETPMGSPGQWEEISTYNIASAAASANIIFSLSKVYSRLVLTGVSVLPASTSFQLYSVDISDDAGATWEATNFTIVYQQIGSGFGIQLGSNTLFGTTIACISATFNVNSGCPLMFRAEWDGCDKIATRKAYQSDHKSINAGNDDNQSRAQGATQAVCDVVNAIRLHAEGPLLASGILSLYGLRA